jgi:Uma2 family endonuclease
VAIEVLSPDDRTRDVHEKIDEYLARGVLLVAVVHPDDKIVEIFRPGTDKVAFESQTDILYLSDVIPGFSCQLREIFQ